MEQLHLEQPRHHRGLRRERRDGARRGHRAQGRRQEARQGHQDRVDRRHPQRRAGHRRRHDQRGHRVQPALRAAGVRDRAEVLQRRAAIPENVIISDREYDSANAEPSAGLGQAPTERAADCNSPERAVLEIRRGRRKRFPGVLALDGVGLRVRARRGARAGRRERRRQVDADQGAHRRLPARRRRGAVPRRAGALRPAARRPARRHLHDLPGGQPRPADERGAQPLPRPRAAHPVRADRRRADEPRGRRDRSRLRHRRRRHPAAALARPRRAADGRAGAGAVAVGRPAW